MNSMRAHSFRHPAVVSVALVVTFMLAICLADETSVTRPLTVYTVNYPLQYFAERIAGERASVKFPAPRDVDPAFWRPSAETIIDFQNADLILLNGAGYARWRALASLPRSRLLDTAAGFRIEFIRAEASAAHRHGPSGEHDHGGTAFTTWLDFGLAIRQAQAVADALARLAPEARATFEANFAALERELIDLDRSIGDAINRDPDHAWWLASHPVYQYLARRHEFELTALTWEPDAYPDESEWRALEALLVRRPSRWMLWESEPLPVTKERLAALGVNIVVFDPCANLPPSRDFLQVMRDNVSNLSRSYE